MPNLRAIREETNKLSAGFVVPSYSTHEYVANDAGVMVEKRFTASCSDSAVDSLSSIRISTRAATINVVEKDSLLAAKEMLLEKSLFQRSVAAFLDQVFFSKSSDKILNEFLAFLQVNTRKRNDFLFGKDRKLSIARLKSFKSLTGDSSHDKEVNTFLSLEVVQAFIAFFDENDQAEKNFNEIKRALLRELSYFLHHQKNPCNRVLVLNTGHPSVRGGNPDLGGQEEHFYRAIAGLTALEEYREFKTARLCENKFTLVRTLLVQNATVFRQGTEYRLLRPSEQYQIDVIYSAPPSAGKISDHEQYLKRAIYAQLHTAKQEGYENLVLCAFACEEATSNPAMVAELYGAALRSSEFRYAFKRIHFAISNPVNRAVFEREFPLLSPPSFLAGESSHRSAFRSIPRSSRSTSSSVSTSTETTTSLLSSTREVEGGESHQQKALGRTSVVRSCSTEFFKSTQTNVSGRRSALTPR